MCIRKCFGYEHYYFTPVKAKPAVGQRVSAMYTSFHRQRVAETGFKLKPSGARSWLFVVSGLRISYEQDPSSFVEDNMHPGKPLQWS